MRGKKPAKQNKKKTDPLYPFEGRGPSAASKRWSAICILGSVLFLFFPLWYRVFFFFLSLFTFFPLPFSPLYSPITLSIMSMSPFSLLLDPSTPNLPHRFVIILLTMSLSVLLVSSVCSLDSTGVKSYGISLSLTGLFHLA